MIQLIDASRRVRKALLIGIDGLMFRLVTEAEAPTLQGLRDEAVFAESSVFPDGVTKTSSGPAWSTITTGTWPAKHGVSDNLMEGARLGDYPDLLTRVKRAQADALTFCFACWPPITATIIGDEVDRKGGAVDHKDWTAADRACVAEACDLLGTADPTVGFLWLGAVDMAGHKFGVGPEYRTAIEDADRHLAHVLETVRARASYPDEDWLVVVTTDHGHRPEGGHGGQSDDERGVFVIAIGNGLDAPRARSMQLVDIAPTLLTHLDVKPEPAWNLDGTSVLLG